MSRLICSLCDHRILSHNVKLQCNLCSQWCHFRCINYFSNDDLTYAQNPENLWSCPNCNCSLFPFNHADDDVFHRYLRGLQSDDLLDLNNLDELLFSPYEFEDIVDVNNPCMDVDPDTHYLNHTAVNSLNECKYFTSMSFEQELKDRYILNSDKFSLFHLNIRSVSKNLNDLELFLSTMSFKFMCLGLSETWLYENIVDCANTAGYNHIYKCRTNRKGGAVSLLLKECISFKVREDLSLFNEKFETIFIEIDKKCVGSTKNIITGVVYRIPGTDVNDFNLFFRETLYTIKEENKLGYIMGDYNLNLLNSDNHVLTNEFIDIAFSNSFFPLITRPTRITKTTSTLIDNILTNDIDDTDFINGIFINDTSDHLPIFCIKIKQNLNSEEYFYTRKFNSCSHGRFRSLLSNAHLNEIMALGDPKIAVQISRKIMLCIQ